MESFKLAGSPESVYQRRLLSFKVGREAFGEQGAVSCRLTRGVNVEVQISGLSPAAKGDLLANLAQEHCCRASRQNVPHTRPHKPQMLHGPHG